MGGFSLDQLSSFSSSVGGSRGLAAPSAELDGSGAAAARRSLQDSRRLVDGGLLDLAMSAAWCYAFGLISIGTSVWRPCLNKNNLSPKG